MVVKQINKELGVYACFKGVHVFYGFSFIEAINNALAYKY